MNKFLKDISLEITEPEYRKRPEYSYSTLATFERSEFKDLPHLFDKKSTASLTFGSAVDAVITGGWNEFNEHFIVADFSHIQESVRKIIKTIFDSNRFIHPSLNNISDEELISFLNACSFRTSWKDSTRLAAIRDASEYYDFLHVCEEKTVLTSAEMTDVQNAVYALQNSLSTKFYFSTEDESVDRFYQLKFAAQLNGIGYRCMFDEIIVDHTAKTIQPVDLKTSSHEEYDFWKSFITWSYQIQARLYARILQSNISKDPYFKDFKILPYHFVVVNKFSLTPLVWQFDDTFTTGSLFYGKNKQIEMRDPEDIGRDLKWYLENSPRVPKNINENYPNNLISFLNEA